MSRSCRSPPLRALTPPTTSFTSLSPRCYQCRASRSATGLPFLFLTTLSRPSSPSLLFIRDYLQFSFVLAPRHSFSHPHACFILRTSSLRATGVAPKRLTLAPPPFLRPVGILLPAPLPPRQPRACNAPTTLPGWTVWLHDILLRVYDETQLLLTFARTMSPCQVGKHVYLIACTDIPVLIPDSRARDAIYLVVVLLHDGSIGHNRLNFVCSLE